MKTRLSVAALIVVSAASALADQPLYRITIVEPTAGDLASFAYSINNNGQVAGISYTTSNVSITRGRAMYYDGGVSSLIGGGISRSQAYDINAAGQVAVQSIASGIAGAYRYDSNTNTVTTLDGSGAVARGIAGNGMMVGTFGSDDHKLPVSWGPGSAAMSLINTESGVPQGYVYAANENGQVLGFDDYLNNPGGAFSPTQDSWVWQNGNYIDLNRPSGQWSQAYALNESGQAVGVVTADGTSEYQVALWDYSSGTANCTLLTDFANKFMPTAINNSGAIVGNEGFWQRYATNFTGSNAFLYQDGMQYNLNTLLDLTDAITAGFTITGAMDINDKGQIVGLGVDASGRKVGYIATLAQPVPEPASLLAMGGFLSAMALRRRRRS